MPNKEDKIGAFWEKVSQGGAKYFSGELNLEGVGALPVVMFPNSYKAEGDKQPDLLIYRSKPRP